MADLNSELSVVTDSSTPSTDTTTADIFENNYHHYTRGDEGVYVNDFVNTGVESEVEKLDELQPYNSFQAERNHSTIERLSDHEIYDTEKNEPKDEGENSGVSFSPEEFTLSLGAEINLYSNSIAINPITANMPRFTFVIDEQTPEDPYKEVVRIYNGCLLVAKGIGTATIKAAYSIKEADANGKINTVRKVISAKVSVKPAGEGSNPGGGEPVPGPGTEIEVP